MTSFGPQIEVAIARVRADVARLHGELTRYGLVVWTGGNVSGRVPGADLFVIKPSGVSYDDLAPENMILCDLDGNVIPGTPENLLFAEFSYRSPRGWFVAADAIYVDEQFGDSANTVVIPDYTLANLRMGYEIELDSLVLSPFIGVNNLSDETYTANARINAAANRYFEPGPGRTGYGGIAVNWKFR